MLRYIIVFLLLLCSGVSAQVIKGQVLIYGTEDPLANASVYYDGMYKGGISDELGYFNLAATASGKTPIIISAVGYHSTSIADYATGEFIKVYLQAKTYSIAPVVVTFDGMTREEKEAIFRREFIGISVNSNKCEILNMDDIDLVYSRKLKTVEAFATEPIILHNKALGFKITYYLDQFTFTPGNVFFAGNYFYEPDTLVTGKELTKVLSRRRAAYLGSRMHFIRALYNDQLKQEGYKILSLGNNPLEYKDLVVDSGNGKNIHMKTNLAILYKGDNGLATFLIKRNDFVFIDKSGFYEPSGMTWSGRMADQRMSELLPFEYTHQRNKP